MKVEIWTDILCPWCYIGKREFENALSEFKHKNEVEVSFHSFELDPNASKEYDKDIYGLLAEKYQTSLEKSKAMHANLEQRAKEVGLNYQFDILKPTNSYDAHRLIHFAAKCGKQAEMIERLSAAYLTEGKHIGKHETLVELAKEVGLDAIEAQKVIESEDFGYEVRTDEQEARQIGISGVPYFVFNRKYGISGAQPKEVFKEALENIHNEAATIQS